MDVKFAGTGGAVHTSNEKLPGWKTREWKNMHLMRKYVQQQRS